MWSFHPQEQQRGAQPHVRDGAATGAAPDEATRDREAQQHDRAGDQALQPGDYPASPLPHGDRDNTPTAPEPEASWDEVVQPERVGERAHDWDDDPLPEGK